MEDATKAYDKIPQGATRVLSDGDIIKSSWFYNNEWKKTLLTKWVELISKYFYS
jgi:hypothetical protein